MTSALPWEAGSPPTREDPLVLRAVESCDPPPYFARDAAGPAFEVDLPYGEHERQTFDLALPTGEPAKLLVVLIHGGGWTSGKKDLFQPTIRSLSTLGYAAATVEYRLARTTETAFPVGLADVRCAIRAAKLRAGTGKLVLVGASAGGHLAALVGLGVEQDGDCADRSPLRVDGVALYYAPLALDRAPARYVPIMRQAVDELLYGVSRVKEGGVDEGSADWLERARAATPGHFVTGRAPPTVVFHGTKDMIVPLEDAREYVDELADAGVPELLLPVADQGHGFAVLGRTPPVRRATCTLLRFLEQVAAR